MPSIEDLDAKIENKKREIEKFEKQKKELIAKYEKENKDCQKTVFNLIGEWVVNEAGVDWKQLNLNELKKFLNENKELIRLSCFEEEQELSEAKKMLNSYKKTKRMRRKTKKTEEPKDEISETQLDSDSEVPVSLNDSQMLFFN